MAFEVSGGGGWQGEIRGARTWIPVTPNTSFIETGWIPTKLTGLDQPRGILEAGYIAGIIRAATICETQDSTSSIETITEALFIKESLE